MKLGVASWPSLPWAHPVNGWRAAVDPSWRCGAGKRRRQGREGLADPQKMMVFWWENIWQTWDLMGFNGILLDLQSDYLT